MGAMVGSAVPAALADGDLTLSISPEETNQPFGRFTTGTRQALYFRVTNGTSATVTGLQFDTSAPQFAYHPQTSDCEESLPAGASCDVVFSFRAVDPGVFEGSLIVTADGGLEASLDVSGTAYEDGWRDDLTPPVVGAYYLEGIARIDVTGERVYAWPYYDAHDPGHPEGGSLAGWEEQSRPEGGTWEQRLDEHTSQYYPTGPAQLRVRVTDKGGNRSEWKTIDTNVTVDDASKTAPSAARDQDWTGSWAKQTLSGPYKRTVVSNGTSGAKARLTATARRFALVARRTRDGGRIQVYVDGVKQGPEINLKPLVGSTQDRVIVWQKRYGTAKKRTVEVRTLTRPAGHRKVRLDAWIVER